MPEPIRILIVDDHAVVREGLRAFLRLQDGLEVAGEAADGVAALGLASALRPDLILLDLVLPGDDGATLIPPLLAAAPGSRVLVLTSFADDAQVLAATTAGATGYLLKDVDPAALAEAIRDVHAGRVVLHPEVAGGLVRRVARGAAAADDLTARERDVLALIVEGLANKQIAARLGIGEKTVKTHVSRVLSKLGAADRTQAAVAAIRQRLVR